MAYSIQSPNSQEDYAIDQYRLNRLGGANLDYQLAEIQNQHPDWTPDQVRMAANGQLGGAPSTRLLTGYGLPARYRITGADPQQQPPISAVNPGGFGGGANSLANSLTRQQNAFRLGQISKAQSQLDKLKPDDDNYDTEKANLQGRVDALTEEGQSSPQPPPSSASLPAWAAGTPNVGEGTAGEEAPVYRAGGPDAFKQLSNGGSVYFGSTAGAPAFRIAPPVTVQDMPPAGTVGPSTQTATAPAASGPAPTPQFNKWSILKNAVLSGIGGGSPAVSVANAVEDPNNVQFLNNDGTQSTGPTAKLSPDQIKKRIALQSQISNPNTPPYVQDALNAKARAFDSAATNAPAPAVFTTGPQSASSQVAPNAAPQPPDAAIVYLKANPDKASDFDAKYGNGAAASVLGQ